MTIKTIPIFPLPDVTLFPGTYLPLHIFEPRYRLMIEYCSESDDELAVSSYLPKNEQKNPNLHDIYLKFGWGKIIQKEYLPDGRSNIVLEGMGICELIEYQSTEPFRIGKVKLIDRIKANPNQENFQELLDEIILLTKRIIVYENAPPFFMEILRDIYKFPNPIDFICSLIHYDINTRQKLLEEIDEIRRAEMLRDLLRKINLSE